MVGQGEIYDHRVAERWYRVLVVSTDAHNDVRTPWVAPIRHGTLDAPPHLIALADVDPLGGSIDLGRLDMVPVTGTPIGIVTGATMQRVREAIQTLFSG